MIKTSYRLPAFSLLVPVILLGLLLPTVSAAAVQREKSFSSYTAIPGAKPVGAETCTTCHDQVGKSFQHAFHAQQGVVCEDCHGNGSLHEDGGGDVTKIVSFTKRSAAEANGVCLGCHARAANVRNWMGGSHAANHVRCTDCHQVHSQALQSATPRPASFTTATEGAFAARLVSPETNVVLRPASATNDACLKCHETERAQMSMPYHHPLREGKMSCVDCHDPHGGPGGNNLRTANVNQLCLGCHAQYRGPFSYQHPPVSENCMICHNAHGSPNTNLLSVSMPALCLQCHAGHHNGAGLPIVDRCTNCHGSIHGTDVATPSGGSRFIDKGATGVPVQPSSTRFVPAPGLTAAIPMGASHASAYVLGGSSAALALLSQSSGAPLSGGNALDGSDAPAEAAPGAASAAYSVTPAAYRFIDGSGYLGRVGEYDSLDRSAGVDAAATYVSPENHLTIVSRGNIVSGNDYSAKSQLTVGERMQAGFDMRSFVQQQDHYLFYVGQMSSDFLPPAGQTDLIPAHQTFAVTRRLGSAYARLKLPRVPVHVYVEGNWQARSGVTQLAYLDENSTATCGEQCHWNSQYQRVNYTTRNIRGGADVDLGPVRLAWSHTSSTFNDRLTFPIGNYGPFTPADEPPPPPVPVPPAVAPGNYYLDIPSPNQASSDHLGLTWTASPKLAFNGNVSYTRLRNSLTSHPQNDFDSDNTLTWRPLVRLRVTADYHQHNLINDFVPYYGLFGNVSYHRHAEGVRADYELPAGFDVEASYRRSGITRSNAALWPQIYSFDNTDLLTVVPSSFSNTTALALRYHARGLWSARAGYEWTGTRDPGYLIVPRSDNRAFFDASLTPAKWVVFTNDLNLVFQNAFPAIPLIRADGTGAAGDFQRRNRFYTDTASATLRFVSGWDLGLGYSYQENNLVTYMGFQNDPAVNFVLDEPAVPYKQITQAYWGESTYTLKQRLGLNLRLTFNSSRSGLRPDLNPADAALLGNGAIIAGTVPGVTFDPVAFSQALDNLRLGSTQVSQVIVPQWIGESKFYYHFPNKFEGGVVFYYGSYRDELNPQLNGVLRTFNVYLGRSW